MGITDTPVKIPISRSHVQIPTPSSIPKSERVPIKLHRSYENHEVVEMGIGGTPPSNKLYLNEYKKLKLKNN